MQFRSRRPSPTAASSGSIRRRPRRMPGVRAIFHRENIGKIFRSVPEPGFARHLRRAAPAVRGRCHSLLRPICRAGSGGHIRDCQSRRRCGSRDLRQGEAERRNRPASGRRSRSGCHHVRSAATLAEPARRRRRRIRRAPVKLDQTYVTPAETHNPIELHATTAVWEGSTLTLYESTQGVVNYPERACADVRLAERRTSASSRNFSVRVLAASCFPGHIARSPRLLRASSASPSSSCSAGR